MVGERVGGVGGGGRLVVVAVRGGRWVGMGRVWGERRRSGWGVAGCGGGAAVVVGGWVRPRVGGGGQWWWAAVGGGRWAVGGGR